MTASINDYAQLAKDVIDASSKNHVDRADVAKTLFMHSKRLPSDMREDFVALVLLELLKERRQVTVDRMSLIRACDRVRHAIVRQLKKRPQPLIGDVIDNKHAESQKGSVAELRSQLSVDQALVLDLTLDGQNPKGVANATGMSLATVYRHLGTIRKALKSTE